MDHFGKIDYLFVLEKLNVCNNSMLYNFGRTIQDSFFE